MKKIVRGIDMEFGAKECSHCKKIFDLTVENFHKNSGADDGFDHRCKSCASDYKKEYYIKNKNEIDNRVRKYDKEKKKEKFNTQITIGLIRDHIKKINESNFDRFSYDELSEIEVVLYHYIINKLDMPEITYFVNNEEVSEIEWNEWIKGD